MMTTDSMLATALSGLIGAVTFSGSMVAFGKLQELKSFKKPIVIPMQQPLNALVAVICLLLTVLVTDGITAGCTSRWYCCPWRWAFCWSTRSVALTCPS